MTNHSNYDNSFSFIVACKTGNLNTVEKLLPGANPKKQDSIALRMAAENGHANIVKLLISVSDPKAYNSQALQLAAINEHTECVQLLIPVSDYRLALRIMNEANWNTTLLQHCVDKYESVQQQQRLTDLLKTVDTNTKFSVKRKI